MNAKFVESLKATVLTEDEIITLLNIAEQYKAHKDDVDSSVEDVVSKLGYTGTDAETVLHLIRSILDILNKQNYACDIAVSLFSLMTVTYNYKIRDIIDRDVIDMFGYESHRARGIAFISCIIYGWDDFKEALETNSDKEFIDSVINYIKQNKNKLKTYEYFDIERLVFNNNFADKIGDEREVIDRLHNIINRSFTKHDIYYELKILGDEIKLSNNIFNTLKINGISTTKTNMGAFYFIKAMNKLTDVA